MIGCISNPPYNIRWEPEPFAIMDKRFSDFDVPPSSNANFAFILTALDYADRCALILPQSVLIGGTQEEERIRAALVEKNYIDAVISCPEKMFEATDIAVCILVLDKHKTTATVEFVDMRKRAETEVREQRGQYGSVSHTNRVYKKNVNVFTHEAMTDALKCIAERQTIAEYCKCATIEDIKANGYVLAPSRYIELKDEESKHREHADIIADINRIIREKNACKLTINESLAKNLGLDVEVFKAAAGEYPGNDMLEAIGAGRIERCNYFTTSKSKNEFKFENTSKDMVSSVLILILNSWKQHIYYLNNEENRYLAELRDALLPDLMTGKLIIPGGDEDGKQ